MEFVQNATVRHPEHGVGLMVEDEGVRKIRLFPKEDGAVAAGQGNILVAPDLDGWEIQPFLAFEQIGQNLPSGSWETASARPAEGLKVIAVGDTTLLRGEVASLDPRDPILPFTVRIPGGGTRWVSRWAEAPEIGAPETEVPTITGADAEVARLQALIRDKDVRITALTRSLHETEARHTTHLEEIGRAAMESAQSHGWCSVVRDLLIEHNVPVPVTRYEFTVTATWTVTATVTNGKSTEDVSDSFIRDSLQINEPRLDSDWEDETWTDASIEVDDIESVDE